MYSAVLNSAEMYSSEGYSSEVYSSEGYSVVVYSAEQCSVRSLGISLYWPDLPQRWPRHKEGLGVVGSTL